MINVQERELIVLFAEDEEEGVAEFQHLREVIPPNGIDNLSGEINQVILKCCSFSSLMT